MRYLKNSTITRVVPLFDFISTDLSKLKNTFLGYTTWEQIQNAFWSQLSRYNLRDKIILSLIGKGFIVPDKWIVSFTKCEINQRIY